MAKRRRWLWWSLVITGLLCLAPVACWDVRSGPTSEEAYVALQPVVRIPLDSLIPTGSVSAVFEVTSNRVSRAWGAPFFVVLWRSQHPNGCWVHDFSLLKLEVKITVAGHSTPVEKATGVPYGHSSDTQRTGLRFVAAPGDEVRMDVRKSDPGALPDGELVLAPDWNIAVKDRLVGLGLDADFYHIARALAWVGFALASVGLVGLFRVASRAG